MATLRDGESAPVSPFPLLPLRNGVLFPGTVVTLPIGRERSVALAQTLHRGAVFGVATQKDPEDQDPGEGALHRVGTFVRVTDIARLPGGEFRLALKQDLPYNDTIIHLNSAAPLIDVGLGLRMTL